MPPKRAWAVSDPECILCLFSISDVWLTLCFQTPFSVQANGQRKEKRSRFLRSSRHRVSSVNSHLFGVLSFQHKRFDPVLMVDGRLLCSVDFSTALLRIGGGTVGKFLKKTRFRLISATG